MKTSNMVLRIREYTPKEVGVTVEAIVASAEEAETIKENLQKVNDLKKEPYIYAISELRYASIEEKKWKDLILKKIN